MPRVCPRMMEGTTGQMSLAAGDEGCPWQGPALARREVVGPSSVCLCQALAGPWSCHDQC